MLVFMCSCANWFSYYNCAKTLSQLNGFPPQRMMSQVFLVNEGKDVDIV